MGIFSFLFKRSKKRSKKPVRKSGVNTNPLRGCKNNRYRVAGISYHEKEILKLAKRNPDYKLSKAKMYKKGIDCAYKYKFHPKTVKLVPEPNNPHDPKAVKVIMDGRHIGYIKAGNCAHILNILKSGDIRRIQGEITGGPSKTLTWPCEIDERGNEQKPALSECTLETDNAMIFSASVFVDERIK